MKKLITFTLSTAALISLTSCSAIPCGPSVSKRLPKLPDAPAVAPAPQSAPITVTPGK